MLKFIKNIFLNDYVYCFLFVSALMGLIAIIPVNKELIEPFKEALGDFEVTDLAFTQLRVSKSDIDTSSSFSRFFDTKLRVPQPEADTNIVIVNIGTLDNAALSALINNINQYQPAVIGINQTLRMSGDPFADSLLQASLKQIDKLVYAVRHHDFDEGAGEHKRLEKPDSLFLVFIEDSLHIKMAEMGFENMFTHDKDFKTTRHFYTKSKVNGEHHDFFAVELARALNPGIVDTFMMRANEREIINYLGNIDKFYSIDAEQALNSQFDPSIIKGKIVLLGYLGQSLSDENFWDDNKYYTPLNNKYAGKTFPDMFETVIYANITSQILANRHIEVTSIKTDIIINLIICFLNVVLFSLLFHGAAVWWDTFSLVITLAETLVLLIVTTMVFGLLNLEINLNVSVVFLLLLGTFLELYYGLYKLIAQKISVRYMIWKEARRRDQLKDIISGSAQDLFNSTLKDVNKKSPDIDLGDLKDLGKE